MADLATRSATGTPVRTCVGCRRRRPQRELVRLVATRDEVAVQPARHVPGRGAYVCPDPACVAAASRRDARALRLALRGVPEGRAAGALARVAAAVDAREPGR